MRVYDIFYAPRLIDATWSNAMPASVTVPFSQEYEWIDDGTTTTPAPNDPALTSRFYRVNVRLNP